MGSGFITGELKCIDVPVAVPSSDTALAGVTTILADHKSFKHVRSHVPRFLSQTSLPEDYFPARKLNYETGNSANDLTTKRSRPVSLAS
jgi:hypothetical protein